MPRGAPRRTPSTSKRANGRGSVGRSLAVATTRHQEKSEISKHMSHIARAFAVIAILSFASLCRAEAPGKIDMEAAEVATELIGAPVFAADGSEVGEVSDLLFDDEGQARKVRIKAAAHLGLGTRTIEIPQGAFTLLRGAVVLDLPAEAMQAFPELTEFEIEK
jgi:hypothetical protein